MDGAKFVVVDASVAIENQPAVIDWSLCVLCQKSDRSKLVVPSQNACPEKFQGYLKLDESLQRFQESGVLDSLPFAIDLNAINDGTGIYETLKKNNAVYHKFCQLSCSNRELERAIKRKHKSKPDSSSSPVKTRRLSKNFEQNKCIFCDLTGTRKQPLINVTTVSCSTKIKTYATLLKDTNLMAKVSGAHDLMALEACYHAACLTVFNNRIRAYENRIASNGNDLHSNLSELHGYGLANLASHIDNVKEITPDGMPIFKMTDLAKCYNKIMKEMGVDHEAHSSRLRDRLLEACPYLQASGTPGQEIFITYESDQNVSLRAAARDFKTDAFQFANVAKVIRKDIFCYDSEPWEELLDKQAQSSPLSLRTLLKMIMRGPGSVTPTEEDEIDFDQIVNSLAQIISFHTVKRVSKSYSRRHNVDKEKPVPVYLAMKIYGETRSKSLINLTHQLGLSISYNRVQTILDDKASAVCQRYNQLNVVCPASLHKGDFIIGAADNIDHDTSSYTAKTSFHGTAISLMQFPDIDEPGSPQDAIVVDSSRGRQSIVLPDNYAMVKPNFLNVQSVKVAPAARCTVEVTEDACPLKFAKHWLDTANNLDFLPWPVFNSRTANNTFKCLTRTAVLPLFSEQAHTPAMMAHAMDCVSRATHYINPGQTPVLVVDQPLYTLCRSMQCLKPEIYGEDQIFLMMGSLHIEMAALRALGTLLENSGWVAALVHAEVTTQGRGESMLRASHVTRTRYVHEVTVAVLYSLQRLAYELDVQNNDDDNPVALSFDEWYQEKCDSVPQFKFWDTILRLELTVCQLVASLRSANFEMYKNALVNLVGWFFALDQNKYARWLSVHIRDLANLPTSHPLLEQKFNAGFFVARKTHRAFSAIGLDQNHEQVNATLKGNGGMLGLTENTDSLRKLLVTIPELADIISKFEHANFEPSRESLHHHSDNRAFINLFQKDYESLKATFLTWGNPFSEDGSDLYNIETSMKAPTKSTEIVQKIENEGKLQYKTFVRERLESAEKRVTDTIPQNKFAIWHSKGKGTSVTKDAAKLRVLKSDCELFRKLFIACQVRQYDLNEFFRYENQAWPPSLSALGQIRCIGKSDIIKCLIAPVENATHSAGTPLPDFEAKVYDGPAIVHMLPPGTVRTFQEYADKVFCPYIKRECTSGVRRVDIVWDTYSERSLKSATREKRGHGERFVVNPATQIPKSWPNFLRDSHNKVQLFKILARSLENLRVAGVDVYSTIENTAVSSSPVADLSYISPSSHEEADTRVILHVSDAARNGLRKCMVRTSDSDVLVLAVAYAREIPNLDELWVSIGVGKHHSLINASAVSDCLGPEKSAALPVFHAFSGCDTVSSFLSKGKKSASEAWSLCPEATTAFHAFRRGDVDAGFPAVERFVVTLYDRSSKTAAVNECRRELFTKKGRAPENLPPSQDALRQHCLRAAYQGGHVWGQCLVAEPQLPEPSLWGWEKSQDSEVFWTPKWTTLGQIQDSLLILMRCGCKAGCTPRCKCLKAQLPCTEMCECGGDCSDADEASI